MRKKLFTAFTAALGCTLSLSLLPSRADVAEIRALQDFLLCRTSHALAQWDYSGDGHIDGFDLAILKRRTAEIPPTEEPSTEAAATETSTTEATSTEVTATETSTTEATSTETATTETSTTEATATETTTAETSTTEVTSTEITTTETSTTEAAATEATTTETLPMGEVLEPKGTVHNGFATYYGGGYEGGCAMLDPVPTTYWITAMNIFDYDNALMAGAYLEVTGELGTINVLVTDLLPEGQKGDLDLYVDAFPLIAPAEKGKVPVSWKIVPLDTAENAPVSYKYKEGSSAFWCGVQVRNHRYPLAKLEYLDASGNFVELPRRHYNYFESDSMGAGPFTFRLTDIYGAVIVDENIPFTLNEIQQGHVQFPK